MMPPPISSKRASASLSWSPQSQRLEPNTSPVRQAECMRTRTGLVKSGLPTMMATELPPMASRKTTKRVRVPELSGIDASLAIVRDRMASSPKRATAAASTVMICRSNAMAVSAVTLAARTAGNPCDNLASWIAAAAAIQLAKLSQGLPAVLAANVTAETAIAFERQIITVEAAAVARFGDDAIRSLTIASEASMPLNSGTRTRFVVFRDAMGGSSVAIIVGKPDFTKPVLVRMHSACLTGDVFGSRRCDCGDQLKLALARLEDLGGGIILYLPQEGRGLGLANKMRTYQMQEDGLDTVDANTTLGFDDDERDYGIAARMLQMLNCTRVVLLTNNPAKLEGLAKAGIKISSRMPLEAPINADNRRYLTAKAARAGHRLDHLMTSLADPSDPDRDVAPLAT